MRGWVSSQRGPTSVRGGTRIAGSFRQESGAVFRRWSSENAAPNRQVRLLRAAPPLSCPAFISDIKMYLGRHDPDNCVFVATVAIMAFQSRWR